MQAEKTKNYSISKNQQKNQIVKPRNKIQLLSPAGNFDALVAAVQNGADAVYIGSKLFNARKLAGNFQENELRKAAQYAHALRLCIMILSVACQTHLSRSVHY
ncbi:hypothetical protein HZA96_01025 [Candidatus Woesearchaeota archaeon]|nr:hypothetical protein [Candidatus Woesearchaeota archaeon]